MEKGLLLAIETSCDETAAAVMGAAGELLSDVVHSQVEDHRPYGGVVPEIASRRHLEAVCPVVEAALDQAGATLGDIGAVAVTQGPGLVGALVVGLSFAKALASALSVPVTGVNHVHAHMLAPFLEERHPPFPYVALVASGGHTSLYLVKGFLDVELLGQTRDDAAGEAFDKVAKVLGLPYPGGPSIASAAQDGDPGAIRFPRAMLPGTPFDFSFSGLKTAVITWVKRRGTLDEQDVADVCASFQEAVVDVLMEKTRRAARAAQVGAVVLCGGVAANRRLVARMEEMVHDESMELYVPRPRFCTDNAAMVAFLGLCQLRSGISMGWDGDAYSRAVW